MKKPINEQPRNSQNHLLSTENDSLSPPPHSQAHNWTMANQGLEEKKRLCSRTDVPRRDEAIPAERMIKALQPQRRPHISISSLVSL